MPEKSSRGPVRRFLSAIASPVRRALAYPVGIATYWDFESGFSTVDFGQGISNSYDAYQKVPIVRNAINTLAHFGTRKGFRTVVEPISGTGDPNEMQRIKTEVDQINKRVNADLAWYIGIIKREIYGRAAFHIVRDEHGKIVLLLPLRSPAIIPHINEDTLTIDYYNYPTAEDGRLEGNEVVYFAKDPLEIDQAGLSSVETISQTIKLKRNLERDLMESARRLWAPIGLFQMDTAAIDPTNVTIEIKKFSDEIKPGRSIVTNQKVKGEIFDLKPDIGALVRAIEKADEEMMGNWNIPKALLSREKTLSKATLEYSLKALYEGPVESVQRYFKREIEAQLYSVVLRDLGMQDRYIIKHVWNPVTVWDPELINALANSIAKGAMTRAEMFALMGWEMKNAEQTRLPVDKGPAEIQPEEIQPEATREKLRQLLSEHNITLEELEEVIAERREHASR